MYLKLHSLYKKYWELVVILIKSKNKKYFSNLQQSQKYTYKAVDYFFLYVLCIKRIIRIGIFVFVVVLLMFSIFDWELKKLILEFNGKKYARFVQLWSNLHGALRFRVT